MQYYAKKMQFQIDIAIGVNIDYNDYTSTSSNIINNPKSSFQYGYKSYNNTTFRSTCTSKNKK